MTEQKKDAELLASISRPHPRLLLKSVVPAVIVVVVTAVLVALWLADVLGDVPWQAGLAAIGILIAPFAGIVRYYTLSYQIDDSGLRMGVGLINRRESYVTFARIQDIHLDRSLIDRILGLGTISIQTASGQSAAEVRLFGLTDPEAVRDALYRRLRRHQGIDEDEEAAIASLDTDAETARQIAAGQLDAAGESVGPDMPENTAGTAACPPLAGAAADASAELSQLLRQLADETARLAQTIQQRGTQPGIPMPIPPGRPAQPQQPPTPQQPPSPGPGVTPTPPGTSPGPVAQAGQGAEGSGEANPLTPPSIRVTNPTDSAEGMR